MDNFKEKVNKIKDDGEKYDTYKLARSHNTGRLIIAILAIIAIVIIVVIFK